MGANRRVIVLWLVGVSLVVGLIQATPYYGSEYSPKLSVLAFLTLYLLLLVMTFPVIDEVYGLN